MEYGVCLLPFMLRHHHAPQHIGVSQILRPDFRCSHCGAALQLPVWQLRSLVLFSLVIGFVLTWQLGGPRDWVFGLIPWAALLLYLPVGFLILTVLVRTVPFLVRPTLVLRPPHAHMTTLNLAATEKIDPRR